MANLGYAKPHLHSRVYRHLSVLRDSPFESVAVRAGTQETHSRLRPFNPKTLIFVRDSNSMVYYRAHRRRQKRYIVIKGYG
jgi:hypothetical protein